MIKETFDREWVFHEEIGFAALLSLTPGQPVDLPHDAMIGKPRAANNPSGTHGGFFPGSTANYSKTYLVPESWRGQSIQLEFEGVYMNAEVLVNNQLIAIHPYGYTSFIVDLTPHLNYGQENEIKVLANNSAQPNSRWYSGTGIYRHVWLRRGGDVHIPPWGVFVTTPVVDPAVSVVQAETALASLDGGFDQATLRTTILSADGDTVAQAETPVRSATIQQTFAVKDAKLWSVDAPNLYTVLSEVLVDDNIVDTERTTFGIRSIVIDAQQGFRLNGIPLKLKGGCVHHDHGPLGAASYDRAEERKVELLKSAGFNALRSAHNPPAPALLDTCDRLGMVVIDETFDCWRLGKTPNDYHNTFETWWQRDTASMVKRDRNHPSVIIWSIGNEILESLGASDGPTWSQRQADYVRSLDSTRYVTSAIPVNFLEFAETGTDPLFDPPPVPEDPAEDQWDILTHEFASHLDVVGYNYLPRRYEADGKRYPHRVIAGTETFPLHAYTYWTETERLSHVIGDFVWTAFDYLGETGLGGVNFNGKVDFSFAYPYHLANCGDFDICGCKRPQSYFRDLLWGGRTEPFIGVLDPKYFGKPQGMTPWGWEPMIDSWTFPGAEGKPTQVDVYAIDDEVELLINGTSIGRKPAGAASQNKTSFDVTYQPGVIEAIGYTNGLETERTRLTTASNPVALNVTADRTELYDTYGDLSYVTIAIVDKDGTLVKHGEPTISLEVKGAGELVAIGTANPISEEAYVGHQRKAYQGRLLAVIRTNGEAGEITLTARAEGLPVSQIQLHTK